MANKYTTRHHKDIAELLHDEQIRLHKLAIEHADTDVLRAMMYEAKRTSVMDIANRFAEKFKDDNPSFNFNKFIDSAIFIPEEIR